MNAAPHFRSPQRKSAGLTKLAFILLLLVVFALAGVVFVYRLGEIEVREAFGYIEWLVYASAGIAALGLLGLILAIRNRRVGAIVVSAVTVVAALLLIWVPYSNRAALRESPRLSDITTDPGNPPIFAKIKLLRTATKAKNPIEYDSKNAALQRRVYPDIEPVVLKVSTGEAFERALAAVREAGWTLVTADKLVGKIEAYDTSPIFGFVDDVVIRIWKEDGGSRVDIRSSSRVGRRDAGVNAERVRMLMRAVQTPRSRG